MTKYLVILGGPTASGKTRVGITLAKRFNTEIISSDSRQIYKELEIGTAVPTKFELAEVPHHFIQSHSLNDYYNASMFESDVLQKLKELYTEKNTVLMVGGSGFYINAVCHGIDKLPAIKQSLRKELEIKYKKEGLASIRAELKKVDPVSFSKIDLNNHLRILKALEVSIQSGKPYSSFLTNEKKLRDFKIIRLALDMKREILYERINTRVEKMIEDGLIEEVKSVEKYRDKNALKSVGYREIFKYLDGEIEIEEAVDLIKRNTRKYARKQLTWFRKDKLFPWFKPSETEQMISFIESQMEDPFLNI